MISLRIDSVANRKKEFMSKFETNTLEWFNKG